MPILCASGQRGVSVMVGRGSVWRRVSGVVLLAPVVLAGAGCTDAPGTGATESRSMSPVPSSTSSAADRRTESPSGPQDTASPDPANAGRLVTSIEDLVGVWQAVQLGGSDVASVRDPAGNPLTVRFSNGGRAGFAWTANDGCNTFSGNVSIRSHGQFQADDGVVTLVGCLPADRILYPRNGTCQAG